MEQAVLDIGPGRWADQAARRTVLDVGPLSKRSAFDVRRSSNAGRIVGNVFAVSFFTSGFFIASPMAARRDMKIAFSVIWISGNWLRCFPIFVQNQVFTLENKWLWGSQIGSTENPSKDSSRPRPALFSLPEQSAKIRILPEGIT